MGVSAPPSLGQAKTLAAPLAAGWRYEKAAVETMEWTYSSQGIKLPLQPVQTAHRMKSALPLIFALGLLAGQRAPAQDSKPVAPDKAATAAKAEPKPWAANPEDRFKELFTKCYLSGRWAPLKDGKLGEEKGGDKYNIVSVTKGKGEGWIIHAKMKYRGQEFVLPIPVTVKFAGDTTLLIVDDLTFAYGGIYSARLLIHGRTYSGSWSDGRSGGMLYGVITNEAE